MKIYQVPKIEGDRSGCGILIKNKEGKYLLGLRCKSEDKPEWGFIGGSVELGETPEQAAIRETKEECNLDIVQMQYVGVHHTNCNMDFIFACDNYTGELKAKEDELSELGWFSLEEIEELNLFVHSRATVGLLKLYNLTGVEHNG